MSVTAAQDASRLFAQAEGAFQAGQLGQAEALLAHLRQVVRGDGNVLHLSALVAKRSGRAADAARHFQEALRSRPRDPQILTNFGNLLAEAGQPEPALEAYARAIEADAKFLPGLLNRASLLQKLGRDQEALRDLDAANAARPKQAQVQSMRGASLLALGEIRASAEAFDAALAVDPQRATALAGRASAAMQLGDSEAPGLLRRALAVRPGDPQLIVQLAEALEAEGDSAGLELMEQAVAGSPDWVQGQMTLARMRWEAGRSDDFTAALEQRIAETPRNVSLWEALVVSLGTADRHAEAAGAARRGQAAVGTHPGLAMFEALESSEAGDLAGADEAFARVPPGFPGATVSEARHRLRTREIERSQQLLTEALREEPWDITAWALQGILWRFTGDPRNAWLHEQAGLVAAHELPLTEPEVEAIADRLRSLHQTKAHPLGQSLRGGTQTRGRLFERLEPEVRRLREAVLDVLHRHWAALPPRDVAHPLLRHRDLAPKLEGSWSVRLTGSGYHVSHIHPRGVISSATYFVVPEEDEPGAGHLEIGGAPPELGLDLPPLASFQPRPGRMVLFPSTLYHGTRPFASGERLTAAFDVVTA